MKRFFLAALISIVLHVLIIFTLTRAEIPLSASGSAPGVTRATFVSIDTGTTEAEKGKESNQQAAPAEEPVEKETSKEASLSQEPEKKDIIADPPPVPPEAVTEPVPPEKPEPEEKEGVKPDRKLVEKKKETQVDKTEPEPEVKKAAVKKTTPQPEAKEPQEKKAAPEPEKQVKDTPVEAKKYTEGEQPGEISDKVQGSQDKPGESSSKKEPASPGATAPAENTNQVQDLAEGDVTRRVTPGYPRASRLRREEGQVVIIAEVVEGKVSTVSLERSSGHQRLDRAALEAVKRWEFGFAGARTVRIPVIFRLRN